MEDKEKLTLGILAHVDAGKTTLAESILYLRGSIRKIGRVDHGDAFLDNYELERSRGITIFSKQARLTLGNREVTLLDTPGHVDFSAEMERTLQVLDAAVLVISGADGVQGHVETLWKLLKYYQIPVFLFVNKMDQEGTDREKLLSELKKRLDGNCVDFNQEETDYAAFAEEAAMSDEKLLEEYLESGSVDRKLLKKAIADRKLFPCFFGSALKIQGVEELLKGLETYASTSPYRKNFSARVYKISRDEAGNRLTHLKVTGGVLKVKMPLTNRREGLEESEIWEEKADQIRLYSGAGYQAVNEAGPGSICAVTGLSRTFAGEGLGEEAEGNLPILEPVLTYRIELPEGTNVHETFLKLLKLEEEIPELHIVWNERLGEIHAQVMGEVQIEILKSLIRDRFRLDVEFGDGNIVYKETILEPVEGVGHFEPLRHYAEVHLLLEPAERGSGLSFDTVCSEDVLDRNWQRLILTHLEEKKHLGVLTGSEITDMKITLLAGRAHIKHTEGGDFRQATYRAVRQGLRKAKSILLEPVYEYRLEVPADLVGRAMADIQRMNGKFSGPELEGEMAVLTGTAPVSAMRGYPREVTAYSRGRGRISVALSGYESCHNGEEIAALSGYDPDGDMENPTGSVFCAHGAGFVVDWDQVEDYMHLESAWGNGGEKTEPEGLPVTESIRRQRAAEAETYASEEELKAIFERTYGPVKKERGSFEKRVRRSSSDSVSAYRPVKKEMPQEQYLLVDGYNIIFSWEDLNELSRVNMEGARSKLADLLCNYQGYRKCHVILVFDAYKVEGNHGEVVKYHNIHIVYTKEAETADQYIEKTVHAIGRKYGVTVATSDGLEQVIILGQGARRLSARGLREEIEAASTEIRGDYLNRQGPTKNLLIHQLPGEMAELMEDVRLGRRTMEDGSSYLTFLMEWRITDSNR